MVGAIRWDAWYAPGSEPTQAIERSLSPSRWRARRPFFAQGTPDGIRVPPASAAMMEIEMAQARAAGLDYWAFVGYPWDNPMSVALRLYLESASPGPNFCFFQEIDKWGPPDRPSPLMERQAELLAHPRHQRLRDGRPLLFLGWLDRAAGGRDPARAGGLRRQVEVLRGLVRGKGAANPFIVIGGGGLRPEEWAALVGADAIGSYALAGQARGAPYAELAAHAEAEWRRQSATGWPMVPLVMSGWDRRPRVENPVPWERHQVPGQGMERFYDAPEQGELAAHLRRGLAATSTGAVLIYAWNEFDEGGWLQPTAGCDVARLAETSAVLHGTVLEQDLCM